MTGRRLWILDTDHISLHQRGDEKVAAQMLQRPSDRIAVTVISFEEQVRGRLVVVRRSRDGSEEAQAYARLLETLHYYAKRQVLPFDETAANLFLAARKRLRRVASQDLRIAAVALSVGGVLVTRNRRDFGQVPGLRLEDWTR